MNKIRFTGNPKQGGSNSEHVDPYNLTKKKGLIF